MRHENLEGVNRGNYTPANNEKHLVHYKAELPRHNAKTGVKESHPELLKTGLKQFPQVKRDLEKQGYVIEIVYHPEGKYNTPLPTPKVDARDAEIEALKAELAALKAKAAEEAAEATPIAETTAEAPKEEAAPGAETTAEEVKETPKEEAPTEAAPKTTKETTKKTAKK